MVVYKITSPTGRVYVGSTTNFKKRMLHYKSLDCKQQRRLFSSLNKYGYESHNVEVLEYCTIDNLFERERFYGEFFNVLSKRGLNLSLPKHGDVKSIISLSTIKKMSRSQTGKSNNFFGKVHSDETKKKISIANKGRVSHNKGIKGLYKLSDTSKENMRLSQIGRKHNNLTKDKMRLNNKNLKIVICLETGIFFNGTADAAKSFEINRHTLKNKLNGNKVNNTSMIYA